MENGHFSALEWALFYGWLAVMVAFLLLTAVRIQRGEQERRSRR